MKPNASFTLYLRLFALFFVFCISQISTSSQEDVTLTFWEWYGGAFGDFFEQEAERFHEQHPNITIEVSHFPDQNAYREALTLSFESENAPDVFIRRHSFDVLLSNNWVQSLTPWITEDWIAQFPADSFVETKNMRDGEIYSFPIYAPAFNRLLLINEDLFRAAGLVDAEGNILVPQTWDELRSTAAQITEAGNGEFYGIGIGIKDARHMSWWFDLALLAGAPGSDGFDYRTGQYAFGTHPAYESVVELLLGLKADGSVYPYEGTLDDSNLYSSFGQQQFAMFLTGSWSVTNLRNDFPDFENYRAISLPLPNDGQSGGMVLLGGGGGAVFFMSSQTQHPDEAWLWLDWLASRGFHERMVGNQLDFSIYPDLNAANIVDPVMLQAYESITQYLVYGPFPPARNPDVASVQVEPVVPDVGDVLIGIYTGQITDWQTALDTLAAQRQTALEAGIESARTNGANVSLEDYIFSDWDPMVSYITQSP